MEQIAEIVTSALLVISGIFGLVGSYGLVKLPDPMTRLHAPTKATTVGVGAVLLAAMIYSWAVRGHYTYHELLIIAFLFLTSPVTGNFIAKAHMHLTWRHRNIPPPAPDKCWATFASPDRESLIDDCRHEAEMDNRFG